MNMCESYFHFSSYSIIFLRFIGGRGYIWDVAGAHAIIRSVGYAFEFFSGKDVSYASMVRGKRVGDLILAGPAPRIRELRSCLDRIGSN